MDGKSALDQVQKQGMDSSISELLKKSYHGVEEDKKECEDNLAVTSVTPWIILSTGGNFHFGAPSSSFLVY